MTFRDRVLSGDPVIGTFFRTPSHLLAEVMGKTDLDFVCVDAEHGALDRTQLDPLMLAFASVGLPALIRVPDASQVLSALDMGATGIVMPHLMDGEDARALVDKCTFNTQTGLGARGYAGSTRAARLSGATGMAGITATLNATRMIVGQIEDAAAVDAVDEIVAVDGLDVVFIGRSDLTISMGYTDPMAPAVVEAVELVTAKAREAGRVVGTYTPSLEEIPHWRERGISLFLLGSEHGFLVKGANAFVADVRGRF